MPFIQTTHRHSNVFIRCARMLFMLMVAGLSTQCAGQTQLVIEVPSDMMPETDLQSVSIRVSRLDAMGQALPIPITEQTVQIGQRATDGKKTIPVSLGVFAAKGDDSRRVLVTVSGRRRSGSEALTSAVVAFFPNKTVFYTLYLAGACTPAVSARCEAQGQACGREGFCVDRIRTTAEVLENGMRREVPVPSGTNGSDADVPSTDATMDAMDGSERDVPSMDVPSSRDAAMDVGDLGVPRDGDLPEDPTIPIPRLIAPMSTSMVSSRQVTLNWELTAPATGARVKICRNRVFADPCLTPVHVVGTTTTVTIPDGEWGWYYWSVAGTTESGVGGRSNIVWQFWVRPQNARMHTDTVFASPVNFNGDQYADLAVGAPGGVRTGAVAVYYGMGADISPAQVLNGTVAGNPIGAAVAGVGDLNGDGYSELAVAYANTGQVDIYRGSAGGIIAGQFWTVPGAAGPRTTIASAGDVDGDGFGDLVVGSPTDMRAMVMTGAARVYFGGAGMMGFNSRPAVVLDGRADGDQFGTSVAGGGDINGDGYGDIIVGAPFADPMTGLNAGTASIYYGNMMGVSMAPARVLEGPNAGANFGNAASIVGDIDGDRFADVAIGAPFAAMGEGMVYVFSGGAGLHMVQLLGAPRSTMAFGVVLASAGDVNNDGLADLLVAADSILRAGAVIVFRSDMGRYSSNSLTTELGGATLRNQFGFSVVGAGDVNGDGFGDVLLGAPGELAGSALLYFGGAMGPNPMPSRTVNSVPPLLQFGVSVAQWTEDRASRAHWHALFTPFTRVDRVEQMWQQSLSLVAL